jgi:hypothetical protein
LHGAACFNAAGSDASRQEREGTFSKLTMPLACGVLQALEQGCGELLGPLGRCQVTNAGPLPFADNLA